MRILFIIAMEKEATPIIHILNLKIAPNAYQLPVWLQSSVYTKKYNAHEIFLVTSGKDILHQVDSLGSGILPATILALEKLQPDLLINAGAAGGVGLKGLKIGDIVLCQESACFHDQLLEPDQIHCAYGIGSYPLSDLSSLACALQIKTARISTGASLMIEATHHKQFEKNGAALKDMEAAHIARLCTQANQKLLIVKVVSDLVDATVCPQQQFTQNFDDVMQILAKKIYELIITITRPICVPVDEPHQPISARAQSAAH